MARGDSVRAPDPAGRKRSQSGSEGNASFGKPWDVGRRRSSDLGSPMAGNGRIQPLTARSEGSARRRSC
ncbi:hypothetical protein M6B38_228870 [Iris pallida]|uniref:Uncharacterized protein n=1 Tax=Iris pallida TaxID=29817 RepID=A0AAX6DTD4_IRIPA|nr:hypothetical protein M6B38_228870 [Iris pallida]